MNFVKKFTKSGIPIYILSMPAAQTVACGVLVNVGSRDEKWPEEAGLAHVFEHLFFQGSKKFSNRKALYEYIEEVGGHGNAFTSRELTFFYNQVPFLEFERSVNILSEQIQHSLIVSEKISLEIQVIIQELRQSQDNPETFLQDLTYRAIYKNHPLSHSPLGLEESLSKFKREDFFNFINRYYYPGNFTFFVVGRIDSDEAVKMFDRYFVTRVDRPRNIRAQQNLLEKPDNRIIASKKINQVHINLAAPILFANRQEKIFLDLFSLMIGSGASSPLVEEIRNKRGLCYRVYSGYYVGTDAGLFRIYMTTGLEKHKEVIDLAFSILENNKNNHERLEKVKLMKLGKLALKYENPINIIIDAAYGTVFIGEPQDYKEINESIKDVTIQDILKVTEKYLKPEQFTTALLIPEDLKV